MTEELKQRHSFLAAADLLERAISTQVPEERTAQDSFRALERQCIAVKKISAKRHVFVFLHHDSLAALAEESHLKALRETVTAGRIALHGFAPGPSNDSAAFRDLCQSVPGGSFSEVSFERLPETLEEIYRRLMTGCEISYKLPDLLTAGPLILRVSSSLGTGQAEITLEPAAEPASEEIKNVDPSTDNQAALNTP